MNDILKIGDREFTSRLFVGTGKFSSPDIMLEAIKASDSQMITVAMKRVNMMYSCCPIHPEYAMPKKRCLPRR